MSADLPRRVQRTLEAVYRLAPTPDIEPFVREAKPGEREQLHVREEGDDVDIAVTLPAPGGFDALCQIVEGVSHFVYLCGRIDQGVPTTFLELELQAEVDKFVLLGGCSAKPRHRLLDRLFASVSFLHDDGTEPGERYRLANRLAARFCARLPEGRAQAARLRAFYGGRQDAKLRLAGG